MGDVYLPLLHTYIISRCSHNLIPVASFTYISLKMDGKAEYAAEMAAEAALRDASIVAQAAGTAPPASAAAAPSSKTLFSTSESSTTPATLNNNILPQNSSATPSNLLGPDTEQVRPAASDADTIPNPSGSGFGSGSGLGPGSEELQPGVHRVELDCYDWLHLNNHMGIYIGLTDSGEVIPRGTTLFL